MQYRLTLAALAAAVPLAYAQYSVTVTNHCDSPAYVWSVGDTTGTYTTLDSSNPTWSQPYYNKTGGGGPSIKIKQNNDIWDGGPVTQLEYKYAGTLWYDLSYINGIAFDGQDISMSTSDPSCPSVYCSAEYPNCNGGAYMTPDENQDTLSCGGANLYLTFCSNGVSGSGGSSGSGPASSAAAPPPSSSSTPPPPPPTSTEAATSHTTPPPSSSSSAGGDFLENSGDESSAPPMAVAYVTDIVAVTVTKYVPAETPYVGDSGDVQEKRHEHLHQHKARNSRHFGRQAHQH
jgi:hypothetical protein